LPKKINITGSRIFIEERIDLGKFGGYWATRFDTDRRYLKTDPAGVLKAGGYEKAPTFYGSGADPAAGISDKDRGWWPTDLVAGPFGLNHSSPIYLDVPEWTNWQIIYQKPPPTVGSNPQYTTYRSNLQYISVGGTTIGTFRWASGLGETGTSTDGDGNVYSIYNLMVYPDAVSLFSSVGGVAVFPWQNINTWTGSWNDGEGGIRSGTFESAYRYFDYDANTYVWRYPNPVWNSWCLQFLRTPTNLAIAVTP